MGNELALTSEMVNEDVICDATDLELLKPGAELDLVEGESESDSDDVPGDDGNAAEDDKGDNKYEFDNLDDLIEGLPDNFPKALSVIRSDIAPVIATLDESLVEYYADKLKKKTGALKKPIMALLSG